MITQRKISLFGAIFFSSFLLFLGLGMLSLMVWPTVTGYIRPKTVYQPLLPIAEAREEAFNDSNELPPRVLYPPLGDLKDVTEGDWISIPSIDVRVPLALSPTMKDVDVLKTLDLGAALYPNGVEPGHLGNTFISAHSTGEPWKGTYRFAFLHINELAEGNVIHLDYKGTRYSYRIVSQETVTPTADFRVISDRPVPTVTLMACWPLWSTKERMLIKAELTNITQLIPERA